MEILSRLDSEYISFVCFAGFVERGLDYIVQNENQRLASFSFPWMVSHVNSLVWHQLKRGQKE